MSHFQDKKRPKVSGKGLRIGIAVGRFNQEITEKLLRAAVETLEKNGVASKNITTIWVPGAFELPITLQKMACVRGSKKFHALIALGAVIRGGTPHFDYVSGEASRGIRQVSLKEGIPIAFGLLTTNNEKEAQERSGGAHGNKGEDAALVALEMVGVLNTIK